METDRYKVLSSVIALGSFTKAADSLGYTQSAVSQAVAALERDLGFKIVVRGRSGCVLTPEGERLFPHIEAVLNAQRVVDEKAAEIVGLEAGCVRIGTIASISEHWLPAVIADFQARWPNVEFVIHQGDYELIPEWIRTGKVDFGFVNPDAVMGLQTKVLAEGEMLAVLPRGHALAGRERVPLGELAREPFILLEEGGYYEPLEAFEAVGAKPDVRFTIHDDFAIMAMVEKGLGVSILAELIMRTCNRDVVTRPCEPRVARTLALAWKDEDRIPIASKRFMEAIVRFAGSLPERRLPNGAQEDNGAIMD